MESLIPLAKDLLDGVTGAAEKFSALDEQSRKAILTMLGMAAAAGPIMTTTGGVLQLAVRGRSWTGGAGRQAHDACLEPGGLGDRSRRGDRWRHSAYQQGGAGPRESPAR